MTQVFHGYAYETAAKQLSRGGGVTKQAPQRHTFGESGIVITGIDSAQPVQRGTGCAKRVTQDSHTKPFEGQDRQTAHWLEDDPSRSVRQG